MNGILLPSSHISSSAVPPTLCQAVHSDYTFRRLPRSAHRILIFFLIYFKIQAIFYCLKNNRPKFTFLMLYFFHYFLYFLSSFQPCIQP